MKTPSFYKRGVSLLEVLLAMTLASLVLLALASTYIPAINFTSRSRTQIEIQNHASYGIEHIIREIRDGSSCDIPTSSELLVNVPNSPSRKYKLENKELRFWADDSAANYEVLSKEISALKFEDGEGETKTSNLRLVKVDITSKDNKTQQATTLSSMAATRNGRRRGVAWTLNAPPYTTSGSPTLLKISNEGEILLSKELNDVPLDPRYCYFLPPKGPYIDLKQQVVYVGINYACTNMGGNRQTLVAKYNFSGELLETMNADFSNPYFDPNSGEFVMGYSLGSTVTRYGSELDRIWQVVESDIIDRNIELFNTQGEVREDNVRQAVGRYPRECESVDVNTTFYNNACPDYFTCHNYTQEEKDNYKWYPAYSSDYLLSLSYSDGYGIYPVGMDYKDGSIWATFRDTQVYYKLCFDSTKTNCTRSYSAEEVYLAKINPQGELQLPILLMESDRADGNPHLLIYDLLVNPFGNWMWVYAHKTSVSYPSPYIILNDYSYKSLENDTEYGYEDTDIIYFGQSNFSYPFEDDGVWVRRFNKFFEKIAHDVTPDFQIMDKVESQGYDLSEHCDQMGNDYCNHYGVRPFHNYDTLIINPLDRSFWVVMDEWGEGISKFSFDEKKGKFKEEFFLNGDPNNTGLGFIGLALNPYEEY